MQRAALVGIAFSTGLILSHLAAHARGQDLEEYPRSLAELRQGLSQIESGKAVEGNSGNSPALAALRRLNAYRFLCGVPADVRLNDEQTYYAQAGAELLAKIGRLEHHPENPGLPDDQYQAGFRGTSSSNIYWGTDTKMRDAVEFFMHDSDDHNIARVGHRRWCLNPSMLTTGFGQSGIYVCMWSFDRSRRDIPEWKIVAYPCRGLMPTDYFSADRAWSVSVNPRFTTVPTAESEVQVVPLEGQTVGQPLEIEYKNFNNNWIGIDNVLIFRPKNVDLSHGKRYRVEITTPTTGGQPATLRYAVEFVDLKAGLRPAARQPRR